MSRGNQTVRILSELGGRYICDECADTFMAILDQVQGAVPAPRAHRDEVTDEVGNDAGRPSQ